MEMPMPTEVRTALCMAIRALEVRAFKKQSNVNEARRKKDIAAALMWSCVAEEDRAAAAALMAHFGVTNEEITAVPPLAMTPVPPKEDTHADG